MLRGSSEDKSATMGSGRTLSKSSGVNGGRRSRGSCRLCGRTPASHNQRSPGDGLMLECVFAYASPSVASCMGFCVINDRRQFPGSQQVQRSAILEGSSTTQKVAHDSPMVPRTEREQNGLYALQDFAVFELPSWILGSISCSPSDQSKIPPVPHNS